MDSVESQNSADRAGFETEGPETSFERLIAEISPLPKRSSELFQKDRFRNGLWQVTGRANPLTPAEFPTPRLSKRLLFALQEVEGWPKKTHQCSQLHGPELALRPRRIGLHRRPAFKLLGLLDLYAEVGPLTP